MCTKRSLQWLCFLFVAILFLGWFSLIIPGICADQNSNTPFKVGFICSGAINDCGWNYVHNQGRLYLESKMPNVKTVLAENIPESAESERVMEKMIAQDCKLIFTTSYGFLEPALRVAARHPDVIFMQVNRRSFKNLGTYFPYQYQPMYIAGTIAGRMTKTNKLGFVASRPVPIILQLINAFTMGVRSVNPKATAKVIWINSWSDPPTEAEAAKGLAESGVDVVVNIQDNQTTVLRTAESLGLYSVGCWADAHQLAPKGWLTGAYLDFGPFYVKITKSVIDHTWKTCAVTNCMQEGFTKLSLFGRAVPSEMCKQALVLEQNIKSGKFVIFKGPLKDRDGKKHLTAGQVADPKWLANIDFFVPGVDGSLPKK